MKNIFEGAKFGDWYMTSEGYKMCYVTNLGNPNIAELVIPTTGIIKHVFVNGYLNLGSCMSKKQFIIGKCEPDIDEEKLDELAENWNINYALHPHMEDYEEYNRNDVVEAFKYGYRKAKE